MRTNSCFDFNDFLGFFCFNKPFIKELFVMKYGELIPKLVYRDIALCPIRTDEEVIPLYMRWTILKYRISLDIMT